MNKPPWKPQPVNGDGAIGAVEDSLEMMTQGPLRNWWLSFTCAGRLTLRSGELISFLVYRETEVHVAKDSRGVGWLPK